MCERAVPGGRHPVRAAMIANVGGTRDFTAGADASQPETSFAFRDRRSSPVSRRLRRWPRASLRATRRRTRAAIDRARRGGSRVASTHGVSAPQLGAARRAPGARHARRLPGQRVQRDRRVVPVGAVRLGEVARLVRRAARRHVHVERHVRRDGRDERAEGRGGRRLRDKRRRKEDRRVVPSRRAEHQDQGAVSV